jgi:signal transduction histidine kinase
MEKPDRTEHALRESEERYRTLFELGSVAVYSCDTSGVIQEFNPRAAELWGRAPTRGDTNERFCGSFKMYQPDGTYLPHDRCPMADVLTGALPRVHDGEVHIERPDGSRVVVIVSIRALKNEHGEIIGAINCFYDITDRNKAERAVEAAREVAENANRVKAEFLTGMSHEMRTPLNAISGYVELLQMGIQGPVTDSQREALQRIEKSGRHLLSLINDVLNFAKLEAGKVEYQIEDIPLAAVVTEALLMTEPQAAAKQLRCGSAIDTTTVVRSDTEKLRQILINLLSNAVKFTPARGEISLSTRRSTDPEKIVLAVSDSGPGVPAAKRNSIFDPFVQLQSGPIRTSEGTGLGLAISRDLARAMGGDLTLDDQCTSGATFLLSVPRSLLTASAPGGELIARE